MTRSNLLGPRHDYPTTEFSNLLRKIGYLKKSNHGLQGQLIDLQKRVYTLEESSSKVRLARAKYIIYFKRDKLRQALNYSETCMIQDTNGEVALEGNIVLDADLYEGQVARRDRVVFEQLYGLDPAAVKFIDYQPTITLLNHHITIISSNTKATTERYHTVFKAFINVLKNSGFAGGYLESPRSELEAHYWGTNSRLIGVDCSLEKLNGSSPCPGHLLLCSLDLNLLFITFPSALGGSF